jgi:hypothetical protein
MSKPLSARQRQTHAAREALAARFSSPEERSEFYRALGRTSAARRVVLSRDEVAAALPPLAEAYALLARIVARARHEVDELPSSSSPSTDPESAA